MPATKEIPDWYKRIPAFRSGSKPTFSFDGTVDTTVKMCIPVADIFRAGYIQNTWADVHFEYDKTVGKKIPQLVTSGYVPVAKARQHSDVVDENSEYYEPFEFAWQTKWMPVLPDGYSALVVHPFNREELPFSTMGGIIDADKFHHDDAGNHPFFIKKGFEGLIPAGTPMYQVIPFKRDDWEASLLEYEEKTPLNAMSVKNLFWGAYRERFWSKKTFK